MLDVDFGNITMKLSDLNEDCLLQVLNRLSFSDLMSLAKSNNHLSDVVLDELSRQFSRKTLNIHTELRPESIRKFFGPMDENDNEIRIRDTTLSANVLKEMGHLIRTLSLESATKYDPHANELIYKLIEKHCSDSLVEFGLCNIFDGFLSNITEPFTKVEVVSLRGIVEDFGNEEFDLSDMFPALHRLNIDVLGPNITKIVSNYPHLNHLIITLKDCRNPETCSSEPVIAGLFKKNPQIRNLVLSHGNRNLLQIAADELDLEQLTICNYHERDGNQTQEIHFEHVKVFKFTDTNEYHWPSNITFGDELEEFIVEEIHARDYRYLDFIECHKHLKKLQISERNGMKNEGLLRIASAKLNVCEIKLECDSSIEAKNIIELIESSSQLKRIILSFEAVTLTRAKVKAIAEIFEQFIIEPWIIDANENIVVLERLL